MRKGRYPLYPLDGAIGQPSCHDDGAADRLHLHPGAVRERDEPRRFDDRRDDGGCADTSDQLIDHLLATTTTGLTARVDARDRRPRWGAFAELEDAPPGVLTEGFRLFAAGAACA